MIMMMSGSSSIKPVSMYISISISSRSLSSSFFPIGRRLQFSPPSAPATGIRTGTRIGIRKNTDAPSYSITACVATQKATSVRGGLIGRNIQRWWEKGLQPNMTEVKSGQHLVDSLLNAGDRLVIVDFFSPGCGGCKSLHPKICQFAEMNPDVQFLQIDYEEHKSMCYSLGVHVLPFFRFYRGAQGRLCSFSCTNATIKKFKDALAKHSPDRCSLGPTKGLEEKELLALAANRDLNFNYVPKETPSEEVEEALSLSSSSSSPLPKSSTLLPIRLNAPSQDNQGDKTFAAIL